MHTQKMNGDQFVSNSHYGSWNREAPSPILHKLTHTTRLPMSDSPSEVQFTFPLSLKEEAEAMKESMAYGPARRVAKAMSVTMLGLSLIQVAFAINNPDIVRSLVSWAMPPAMVGVVALLFPKPVPLRYFLQKVKQLRSSYVGPRTVSFSKDGLFDAGPEGAELIRWSAFSDVVETSRFFLFFRPTGQTHFVPKYAVLLEQEALLRELLCEVFMHRPNDLRLAAPDL